ncbi:MAG: SGNH/GDSL hydrolase family protein [Phycisphaeraceae bacterium]|nr:SGNH/GDSL hydrolase family protein [Phycisphaeraceae bacterium]
MIHDELEFHNVAELNEVEGHEGLRLQRMPEHLRTQLDEGTASVMCSPADCEIRFRILDGHDRVTFRLSSESETTIYVYHGPFQGNSFVVDKEVREFTIEPHKRVPQLADLNLPPLAFDPDLVRICFGGPYPEPLFYHGHDGGVAPPRPGDTPDKTYLAYGSSITHGTGLSGAAISYPAHVAWRLGMDLKNFGTSGCCLCQKVVADFLADQSCDLATLELSVNMLGGSFDGGEFRERVSYLVKRFADADPDRPVLGITIFPHFRDLDDRFCGDDDKATAAEFRQILRDVVAELDRPNLSLIEGPELLGRIDGLSHDLIHPGIRGMVEIGEALTRRIRERSFPGIPSGPGNHPPKTSPPSADPGS